MHVPTKYNDAYSCKIQLNLLILLIVKVRGRMYCQKCPKPGGGNWFPKKTPKVKSGGEGGCA